MHTAPQFAKAEYCSGYGLYFVDALCFNQAVGGATRHRELRRLGSYEYSIDGGTTWIVFTSPVTINNLLPSATPYAILVRDDATDICPAQVM